MVKEYNQMGKMMVHEKNQLKLIYFTKINLSYIKKHHYLTI